VLSRVLFVLGGAVATTATAWLITSATAAADTPPDPSSGPVAGALTSAQAGLSGVDLSNADRAGTPAVLSLPGDPGQTAARVRTVTRELRTAVSGLGHVPVDRTRAVPPPTGSPSAPMAVSTRAGRSGSAHGRSPDHTPPAVAAATSRPVPAGHPVARRSGDRPSPAGPATSKRTVVPSPASAPWTPVTVPTAPTGGGAGAPGAGGLGLVDHSGVCPAPALDPVRVVPVTTPLGTVTSGRQPGITPD
jgi:hypothetical protein